MRYHPDHRSRRSVLAMLAAGSVATAMPHMSMAARLPAQQKERPMSAIYYRTQRVGDVDVFYREAGPVDAPITLLLHGFPTSGHMFRDLMPALADRYRMIAPDRDSLVALAVRHPRSGSI